MAMIADRVVVELEAKLAKYDANLLRAEKVFNRVTKSQEKQIRQLEKQIQRSSGNIQKSVAGLAGAFATYFSGREVLQLSDAYTRYTNQLRVAGIEGENLATVHERLYGIGLEYGAELETLGKLFGRTAQAADELGATQDQMLKFTEGVAAALRVQGGAASESRGAIIQLQQALGGSIVRAEEFNSINEGARPILQTVANGIDRFGGSVSKLRAEVIEGKVTSQEFFNAFLKGSDDIIAQAQQVELTVENAFTVLRNAAVEFIGQSAASTGAATALSNGILLLAENIETLALAIATIATVLGVRFVAAALTAQGALAGSAAAMGAVGAASFAMQARVAGAASSMTALGFAARGAGASLLAAFGGPVGIAITGITVAIAAAAYSAYDAAQEISNLEAEAEKLERTADDMEDRLDAAGVSIDDMGGAADSASGGMDALTNAMERARRKAKQLEDQAGITTLKLLQMRIVEAQDSRAQILDRQAARGRAVRAQTRTGDAFAVTGTKTDNETAKLAELDRIEKAARRQIISLTTGIRAGVDVTGSGASVSNGGGKSDKKKKKKGRSGPSAETLAKRAEREAAQRARAEAQFRTELDQLHADELQNRADLTGSIADQLAANLARIDADNASFARQVALDDELSAAKKEELLTKRGAVDLQRKELAQREAVLKELELDKRLADQANQQERDLLRIQADLAEGRQERAEIEQRILDLAQSQRRADLEHLVATLELNGIQNEELRIAKARLARLKEQENAEQEQQNRRSESPLERYRREVNKTSGGINDDLENIAVDGLEALNDGITDAITGAKSLGEAFSNVADQIIADLIRIAVQQLIIAPLLNTIGGGGGFFGGLFGGRASGGNVVGGKMYRVTDGEGFVPPQSGKIIPLGRMQGGSAGEGQDIQTGPTISMSVVAPGANEQTVALIRQTLADATPAIVQAASSATVQKIKRKRIS